MLSCSYSLPDHTKISRVSQNYLIYSKHECILTSVSKNMYFEGDFSETPIVILLGYDTCAAGTLYRRRTRLDSRNARTRQILPKTSSRVTKSPGLKEGMKGFSVKGYQTYFLNIIVNLCHFLCLPEWEAQGMLMETYTYVYMTNRVKLSLFHSYIS